MKVQSIILRKRNQTHLRIILFHLYEVSRSKSKDKKMKIHNYQGQGRKEISEYMLSRHRVYLQSKEVLWMNKWGS